MVYRTMQGKIIDMDKLIQKHELTPAVGNANMNARGDKLGPGGKIVKTREESVAEYYENNPKAKKVRPAPPLKTTKEAAPAVNQPQQEVVQTPKSKKSQPEE